MIFEIVTQNRRVVSLTLVALGMVMSVGSAFVFQYLGGYIPCHLCLLQRNPYYIGIPIVIVGLIAHRLGGDLIARLGLVVVAALMVWGMVMGVYHSGVEWHWWAGPAECSGAMNGVTSDVRNLLSDLNTVKGPKCDEAALRILGLSLAGWNVVVSVIITATALWGARAFKK